MAPKPPGMGQWETRSSSKLLPGAKILSKKHGEDLQRSLSENGPRRGEEKKAQEKSPWRAAGGSLQPLSPPHGREAPQRFEGLEGLCNAIKTFLPAKHETPKVYGKPLSSDVCISSGILGAVVQRNREKSKQPIMMVSGRRLCDYWLPHESPHFWDAEHVSAAKREESSLAAGARGTQEGGRARGTRSQGAEEEQAPRFGAGTGGAKSRPPKGATCRRAGRPAGVCGKRAPRAGRGPPPGQAAAPQLPLSSGTPRPHL